ncbi:MAG TPA: GNAT family N-acetyltransferase [Gaiellaceae bacterium]|nr:GNAT family N-acetyltransferase [Gaiellaceae bacterium]
MSIRDAQAADLELLRRLRDEFLQELDKPPFFDEPWDTVADAVADTIANGVALIAEDDGAPVGYALASVVPETPIRGHLYDLYVNTDVRGRGVGRELIGVTAGRLREHGVTHLSLDVALTNDSARRLYERLGFRPYDVLMAAPLDDLERQLAAREQEPSFASTHVQTDDVEGVRRAIRQFMPRVGHTDWSDVSEVRNGWVTVTDELCDRDRSAQRRLGAELSERMGVPVVALALEENAVVRFFLFDRGRMVDEYLSVPTYYGDLNMADELSLAANATLVARLTGADAGAVRAVARTASTTAELPPARELLDEVAAAMNLEARIER